MDTSEAARALVRRRWGTRVVDRSIAVLHERRDELGERQLADLRELLEDHDDERNDDA